jgi:hypothetical protein
MCCNVRTRKNVDERKIDDNELVPPIVRRGRAAPTRRRGVLSNVRGLGTPLAAAGVRSLIGRRMGGRAQAADGRQ